MEAILKVGGSLAEEPASLRKLCQKLSELAETHSILVLPGGGRFADVVREFDKDFQLSNTIAHKLAILAMDQYGLFLSDITPNSHVYYTLEEFYASSRKLLPILLPSKLVFRGNPLEHSWDVTSDTIAAYVAALLEAEKLILVTDVDGIFSEDPKKNMNTEFVEELTAQELLGWNRKTSVDKILPKILLRKKLDCYVVNGKYPKRIEQMLEKQGTRCTHITS